MLLRYIRNNINIRSLTTYSRCFQKNKKQHEEDEEPSVIDDKDLEYDAIASNFFDSTKDHNCFIIHPYVKWGEKKQVDTNPASQLEEAVSLIRTLAPWKVRDTVAIPLQSLNRKQLFGSGNLETLKQKVRRDKEITSVFINISTLTVAQLEELQSVFKVQVMDRYKIVMEILRLHATSKHAKLQVALAEIPYLQSKIMSHNVNFQSSYNYDTKKMMLLKREQKIKSEITKLRSQRGIMRKKRKEHEFPTVAVVGYTNAGKTSLIQILTGDKRLQPKDQLFATLDVTIHTGLLPSTMKVLYVDTVGFISNIPTNLIECFIATLEDAMHADLILHVEDVSNDNCLYQRKHVLQTLQQLSNESYGELENKLITVGNKCDKGGADSYENLLVSCKSGAGIDDLKSVIEKKILEVTGRSVLTIRVSSGGDEARWLYKNSTVIATTADDNNMELQKMKIIITKPNLEKFKHHFLNRKQ